MANVLEKEIYTCQCSIVQIFLPQYLTEFIDNNRLLTELWLTSSFCGLKKTRFKTASYDCGQKHDCFFFDFLYRYGEDVIMVVLNPQRTNSTIKALIDYLFFYKFFGDFCTYKKENSLIIPLTVGFVLCGFNTTIITSSPYK